MWICVAASQMELVMYNRRCNNDNSKDGLCVTHGLAHVREPLPFSVQWCAGMCVCDTCGTVDNKKTSSTPTNKNGQALNDKGMNKHENHMGQARVLITQHKDCGGTTKIPPTYK